MIDKSSESTTFECTLPTASIERLNSLAERLNLSLEEAMKEAIDQSFERLSQEVAGLLSDVSALNLALSSSGNSIQLRSRGPRRPDTVSVDPSESIPIELPRSLGTPIHKAQMIKRWPEPLSRNV